MADAGDAIAEVTPAVEPAAPAAPAAPAVEPGAPAAPAAPVVETTPDYSWIAEAGGEPTVKEALAIQKALLTEEGQVDFFVEAGIKLGATPEQLAALFPEVVTEPDPDADKPLTKAEIEQLIADQVQAPLQAQREADQTAAAQAVIRAELDSKQIPDADRELVLRFADKHIAPEEYYDADKLRVAIAQGQADFTAYIDAQVTARIDAKIKQGEGVPTPLAGGGSPGGEDPAEPMSMKEAKARVRAAAAAGN